MSDKAGPSKDTAKPRPSPLEDQASKADDENARKSQRHPDTEYGKMKQKFGPPKFSNPSTMVTLVIGEGKKEFLVHREVACFRSPVLEAAFEGNFQEAHTQTYALPHIRERTGKFLLQFLYFQRLEVAQLKANDKPESKPMGDNVSPDQLDENLSLVELWALSDELQMPRLQNLAIKAIDDIGHKLDSVATFTIDLSYKLTAEESALRRYIVATCCYELDPVDYKESPEDFPKEMLIELAVYTADDDYHIMYVYTVDSELLLLKNYCKITLFVDA